jgi:hypothetical protein
MELNSNTVHQYNGPDVSLLLGLGGAFLRVPFFETLIFYSLELFPDAMLLEGDFLGSTVRGGSVFQLRVYPDGFFEGRKQFVAILGCNKR